MSALGRLVSGLSVVAVLAIVSQTDGAEFNAGNVDDSQSFSELDPLSAAVGFVDRDCWIIGEPVAEDSTAGSDQTQPGPVVATAPDRCVELTEYEAFAVFDLGGGDYPGVSDTASAASQGCQDRFETFQGSNWIETSTGYVFVYPTQNAWERRDDRQVTCAVTSAESLTQPKLGANQNVFPD